MKAKLCHRDDALGVSLHQTGLYRFRVTYGKQVKSDLDYTHAALELGTCIMHALACESKIDVPDLPLEEVDS